MSPRLTFILTSALLATTPACSAAESPARQIVAPPNPSAVIAAWGGAVARRANVAGAELNEEELRLFLSGVERQLLGQPAPVDLPRAAGDLERLGTARLARIAAARRQQATESAQAFFRQLTANPRVITLRSGLAYEILAAGTGTPPRPQETVTIRYTGHLIDGTEFTQMDPYEVVLVPNRLTPALYEGIQHVGTRGKIRLYVPPQLLEGDTAKLGIAPGAAAIFELEVLAAHSTSAEDLANSLLPPAPEPPTPPPSGYSASLLIEAWGWTVGRQAHADGFELSAQQVADFIAGVRDVIVAPEKETEAPGVRLAVREYLTTQRHAAAVARQRKQQAAADALYAALDQNPRVIRLPDGLRYEILAPGHGPLPRLRDVVIVDYVGRLLDGTVFDRTDNEPLHVEVGSVIDGWSEGIQKVAAGGRIRLYVPPALGYGSEDSSGVLTRIPADSTLIYEITLLGIEPSATPGATRTPAIDSASHP